METTDLTGADWPYVLDLLPADLDDSARAKRALLRKRNVKSAPDLLRMCLCYGCCDFSLQQVAACAALLGFGDLSDVAVMKRLRKCGDWLGHLIMQFLTERGLTQQVPAVPVRIMDATTISEPGSTGTDWRLHMSFDLSRQLISSVELTGPEGGESFLRFQPEPGEILLADRGYAHRPAVAAMLDQQAHVVLRLNWRTFPLQTLYGQPFDFLSILETLAPGEIGDWPVQFEHDARTYEMRLLALRKTKAAAEKEQRRLRRDAKRKGRKIDQRSLQAAHFVYVLTDLTAEQLPAAEGLELYRLRWQIEIAFKRLKSLLHLDHLRAKEPALARTYLYAKLLGALLVEELTESSLAFFPWGYRLFPTDRQSLALAADLQPVAANGDQGCADH
jgi:hypothetical protein